MEYIVDCIENGFLHFNSGSRSSLTISQTQYSSTSLSSFSLLRTARARTSSAHVGSVCSRWDSLRFMQWCRNCLKLPKKLPNPFCSSRDCSAISATPLFLCCGHTWSAWWPTHMRVSSAASQRSSLDWSEVPSIGATQRFVCIWLLEEKWC